jgi:hypothetical protein
VVAVRQHARQIAGLLGFGPSEQARIAAVVFEIAQHAVTFARRVSIQFQLVGNTLRVLPVSSRAQRSARAERFDPRGMRRLLKYLQRECHRHDERVSMLSVPLPEEPLAPAREDLPWLIEELVRRTPLSLFDEIHKQNQEVLRLLSDALSPLNRSAPRLPPSARTAVGAGL